MATIGEASQAYVPPTTKNISDLDVIDIQWDIKSEEYTNKDNEKFTVEFVEVGEPVERYRVPTSVKKQLKEFLAEIPGLRYFKVRKSGEGLNTVYTVIPLQNAPKATEEEIKSA